MWDYAELLSNVVTPFPALSDLFFMIFAALCSFAFIKMRIESDKNTITLIHISKFGVLVCSIVIVHVLTFSSLLTASNETSLYISATLVYPIIYISTFLYGLFFFLQPQSFTANQRAVHLLIVSSLGLHAFTVVIYAYSLLGKSYAAGNYIDIFWLLAFAFMYFAIVQQKSLDNSNKLQQINISKKLRRQIEVAITPLSILILLIIGFIFSDNLNKNNINVILLFASLLLVFFIIKEVATEKHQERLKATVKSSEKRFHVISNTVPGIVFQFIMNKEGEASFPYVSPRITELLGLDPQAVMDNASIWINAIHNDDKPSFDISVQESARTLNPWNWEGLIIHVNGSIGWFRGESVPTKQTDHVLWTGIIIDVTEKQLAKIELQKANEQLEQRVKERTSELESAMLQADIANNAKSEFLSNMSHELRTPLNAILGFSQLLAMNNLTEKQNDFVNEILEAGEHLLLLIKDILNLNNIELGQIQLNSETVELSSLVSKAIKLVENQAITNNISIKNKITKDINVSIFIDPFRYTEVIVNLLSNAIKYNSVNGVVTVQSEIDGNNVKVNVSDTGNGIEDQYIPNVFEAFERLDKSNSGIDGTGIGLTLSKKITETMGGTIGFETKVGEGSTFWVSFPISKISE